MQFHAFPCVIFRIKRNNGHASIKPRLVKRICSINQWQELSRDPTSLRCRERPDIGGKAIIKGSIIEYRCLKGSLFILIFAMLLAIA
jgi:hypothetical protein